MKSHQNAERLAVEWSNKSLNEADTRHRIIDEVLHSILVWPKSSVRCEKHVAPGYMDYVLSDKKDRPILVIEAKREGQTFEVPLFQTQDAHKIRRVRLKTLVTNKEIRQAVVQVVQYCVSVGSEYACVTNGHTYIFFRAFIKGHDYLDFDAIVIPSLNTFSSDFTQVRGLFSYIAITETRTLVTLFDQSSRGHRQLFYPKNGIAQYDTPFNENRYARFLEPLSRYYFDEIEQQEHRLMDKCYVFASGARDTATGMRNRISDSLTPFFKADGAEELETRRDGGPLTRRIAASLTNPKANVLILYGGKGAGKSTFLRRLFYHDPPQDIVMHAFPILVEFLHVPQDPESLTAHMWREIIHALDQDHILTGPIESLIDLFSEQFTIALKQDLSGLDAGSIDFVRERNRLISEWKKDSSLVVRSLQKYWAAQNKHLVVVFDNTDQLPPPLQDHCFLMAQYISKELGCCTIISMREERYCRARTAGVLDAYHNSGYHLAAPDLKLLFTKRLSLVIHDLETLGTNHLPDNLPADIPKSELRAFFVTINRQFQRDENAMHRFFVECARDNARLALGFFRGFLTSGYTHIDEIISNPSWVVVSHQVVKPMMIPARYNYDENKSLIPNLFQCRDSSRGSHSTAVRILKKLHPEFQSSSERTGYFRVDFLCDEFDAKFGSRRDVESSLDLLLRHGLIEANNRLDSYQVEISTSADDGGTHYIYADEVKLTSFGAYALEHLCSNFTYLDLICFDCGLTDESVYHEFVEASLDERRMGAENRKMQRLESRINRTKTFLEYLVNEESREADEQNLSTFDIIMPDIQSSALEEIRRVEESASRNYRK